MDDAASAYRETTRRGAKGVLEPTVYKDDQGEVVKSAIAIYGDTIHTFVERKNYRGAFLPGFRAVDGADVIARPVGLKFVDHCVGNVELGAMNRWVEFYMNVMGFRMFKHFDDADISTEYSALMSKVMTNGNERIKFPANTAASGRNPAAPQGTAPRRVFSERTGGAGWPPRATSGSANRWSGQHTNRFRAASAVSAPRHPSADTSHSLNGQNTVDAKPATSVSAVTAFRASAPKLR